jgi:hypothetical protein
MSNFVAGGCSFTFGHELSDDQQGKVPSKKSWAYGLKKDEQDYICVAYPGSGNSGIARRVFNAVANHSDIDCVVVMWSFLSRYDWAMPRHVSLENTRWASISPWDTDNMEQHVAQRLSDSPIQQDLFQQRRKDFEEAGVKPLAETIYRHAANEYHETYLSWKSIVWLQNILEKRNIPFVFTLADNSLFYHKLDHHKDQDSFMRALYSEIDLSKWFFFGERCMGFNQWATLNNYAYATTHPLDQAHADAVKLMLPTFEKIIGEKK